MRFSVATGRAMPSQWFICTEPGKCCGVGGQVEENRGWGAGFGSGPKPTLASRRDRKVLFAACGHQHIEIKCRIANGPRIVAIQRPLDNRRHRAAGEEVERGLVRT